MADPTLRANGRAKRWMCSAMTDSDVGSLRYYLDATFLPGGGDEAEFLLRERGAVEA